MKHYEVFADYFSFILQDEQANPDFSSLITDETIAQMIIVLPDAINIGTVRNMTVPVDIDIRDVAPEEDGTGWDRINECSIDIPSGTLVLVGGSDYFPDAPRMTVTPGTYGVRVYYGGLDTLSEDELEGDDTYRIVLWPVAAPLPLRTLKKQ